jgi:hypothetical protein
MKMLVPLLVNADDVELIRDCVLMVGCTIGDPIQARRTDRVVHYLNDVIIAANKVAAERRN